MIDKLEVGQKVWVVGEGEAEPAIVTQIGHDYVYATGEETENTELWFLSNIYPTAAEAAEALRSEAREMLRRADEIDGPVMPEGWGWHIRTDRWITLNDDSGKPIADVFIHGDWRLYGTNRHVHSPDLETAKRECLRAALKYREGNTDG